MRAERMGRSAPIRPRARRAEGRFGRRARAELEREVRGAAVIEVVRADCRAVGGHDLGPRADDGVTAGGGWGEIVVQQQPARARDVGVRKVAVRAGDRGRDGRKQR